MRAALCFMVCIAFVLMLSQSNTHAVTSDNELLAQQQETLQTEKPKEEEDKFKDETVDEHMKYFKEKYEEVFDAAFEDVYKAIKKSITDDLGCMIQKDSYSHGEDGLYKGSIRSDYCLFTQGTDTTYKVLKFYSVDMPMIRGGVWQNGGLQYKFIVKEMSDGKTQVILKGEIKGFEGHVTTEMHFWTSNGMLETRMMEILKKNVKEIK